MILDFVQSKIDTAVNKLVTDRFSTFKIEVGKLLEMVGKSNTGEVTKLVKSVIAS